jgi:Ca2+-binding EF-hand superfamily protein
MRNNGTPDYVVTKEEFIEYYNNISASIDDDNYFKLMIENAWKLTKESRQGMGTKGWANEDAGGAAAKYAPKGRAQGNQNQSTAGRLFGAAAEEKPADHGVPTNATEEMLLNNLRERLAKRGTRGIASIGRKFKIADDNRSQTLDKAEFVKAMHDFRIGMNERQCGQVYGVFDRDGSGEISYDEFLRTIRGVMNPFRKNVAAKCYKLMDKDNSGALDINDIRQGYNAKMNPEVQQGKKTEDEVLAEFLDTFEDHFADCKGQEDARDGNVTMEEWLEYYNNVSMSIDDDAYFELMLNNAWNMDGKKVTKKGWAGEY